MIFIWKVDLNVADSYLKKKKFNKEKRKWEYSEKNADTYEFKTLWDTPEYFKYLGKKKNENSFSQLKPEKGVSF